MLELNNNYKVESIESIEQIEDFDDEYVYDIEVEEAHNFFGNDILIHNSIYVEFGRLVNAFNIPYDKHVSFVVDMWNYGCGPYMKRKYEEYAKDYNCDKNIQELELEKIADTTILLAKKHYAMAEIWKEPGIFLKPMDEIVYKGIEIVKGDTPPFARECQIDFTRFVLEWFQTHKEKMSYATLIEKIKKYKQLFMLKMPDEISKGSSIGDYQKFIANDNTNFVVGLHCPIHVKAAGIANFILNQPNNKRYKVKYNKLKTGDKVKWYYTTHPQYDAFAFLPGAFPMEYALEMDKDKQFAKTILEPCNRILEVLGYKTLTSELSYSKPLW